MRKVKGEYLKSGLLEWEGSVRGGNERDREGFFRGFEIMFIFVFDIRI